MLIQTCHINYAVFPGSFDPITLGHLDIINKISFIFQKITVLIAVNPDKDYFFSVNDRIKFINSALSYYSLKNVSCDYTENFVTDYCEEKSIGTVVRSYRNATDIIYEYELINSYKKLNCKLNYLLFSCNNNLSHINSSIVRDLIKKNKTEDLDKYVPTPIYEDISCSYQNKKT